MRVWCVMAAVLAGAALLVRATSDKSKGTCSWDDLLNPREVAAGQFEKRQLATAQNTNTHVMVTYTFTRIEYAGKPFWTSDAHYGDGVAYKSVAIYAPRKDGAFERVMVASSTMAGWLAIALDAKTGILELRERANSELKGELVLSCNLKTVGTAFSTGVAP